MKERAVVGFIGLGNMGEGMAYNLATKGFSPIVYDCREDPVRRLEAEGATAAATNAEIGERCEIVCVAVFDDTQIDQVVFGNGADAGIPRRHGGWRNHHPASDRPAGRRSRPGARRGRAKGVAVIDAPMTGGANVAAREGTLTFMVGGDQEVVERARAVLEAMSTSIFHVGELGAGAAAKIINNFLAVSQTLLVREALRLGASAGIGEAEILGIVNRGGVGSSWQSINWQRIKDQEAGDTTGRAGMVAMASKDLTLAGRLAADNAVAAPSLAALVE